MLFTLPQLKHLADQAILAAIAAGKHISTMDRSTLNISKKDSGQSPASQVVTDIDRQCEAIIIKLLQHSCDAFDIALLSEEAAEQQTCREHARFQKQSFWCIDPLDGTLPFIEGQPGYSVAIALVDKQGNPLLGVVYDPVTETLLHAITHHGAFRNHKPISISSHNRRDTLHCFLDRSWQQHSLFQAMRKQLSEQASSQGFIKVELYFGMGGVMNACQLLEKEQACYFKFPQDWAGGGSLWDFAASSCIIQEAGGIATDIHGQALDLNRRDSHFMNHRGVLFANNSDIADMIRLLYQMLK